MAAQRSFACLLTCLPHSRLPFLACLSIFNACGPAILQPWPDHVLMAPVACLPAWDLPQERGLKCACERCSEPLARSTDRYLEGMWCLNCTTDVLLAVPAGTPEADAAAAEYEEQVGRGGEGARVPGQQDWVQWWTVRGRGHDHSNCSTAGKGWWGQI